MNYRKREIESVIIKEITANHHKVITLLGPRQVGKTTLMRKVYNDFTAQGKQSVFLDLDIYSQYQSVQTYESCIQYFTLHGYTSTSNEIFYVFLDEFQRYSDMSRILKNIYDHHPTIQCIISGSASLTVKQQLEESLAGRKRIINIYPLTFGEYLVFQGEGLLFEQYQTLHTLQGIDLHTVCKELHTSYQEFLIWGGYPEVALTQGYDEKKKIFSDIFDLIVQKDIGQYIKRENINAMATLLKLLSIEVGNTINYQRLATEVGLDQITTKNYIHLLQDLFIIQVIHPFFTNKTKELVKMPKIYFLDNGVRNFFVRNFEALEYRKEKGELLEATIFSTLRKHGIHDLKYWRSKQGHEVDCIIDYPDKTYAREIKHTTTPTKKQVHGLKTFQSLYPDSALLLINQGVQGVQYNTQMILALSTEYHAKDLIA